jgi:hypothetical protein
MLIYGAFNPAVRTFVLTVAGLSEVAFIALVLSHGSRYLGTKQGSQSSSTSYGWCCLLGIS